MDKRMFDYRDSYGNNSVALVLDMYRDNGNLFIGLEEYDKEYDYWDSYCDVTVNVGKLPFLESAINTEYNGPAKVDFLLQNGFGELTGKSIPSGFCTFPVFKFNADKLKELDPEFFEKYAKEHGVSLDERDVVQDFKDLAKKYGFSVVQDGSCFKLCAKNTDNEWTRWIGFYPKEDKVSFFGNTDFLNIWLSNTRKDFTPEKCMQFVNDLNDLFELTGENRFVISELIDPEDWQEIADVRDAYEDPRYYVKPEVSLTEQITRAESLGSKGDDREIKANNFDKEI